MADVKISELTALTSPDGAEELVVNDGGTTKKITITNATSASLPKAGGTMTGDTLHGDNVKAKFGTGNDLEIFHDGSNSYIKDTGTGALVLNTSQLYINNPASNELLLTATENGGVTLYHDNSAKLATTATGVAVTGTVTADGLTVDGLTVDGRVVVYDTTQTMNGGISTEANAAIINFGLNEGSANRFGGSYTQASQGGMLNFDTRAGQPLFQIYTRAAGTAAATGTASFNIDSSGNVLMGGMTSLASTKGFSFQNNSGYGQLNIKKTVSDTVIAVNFYHNNSVVGSIKYSNTATQYVSSSDYRLKTNVTPMTGATAAVKLLKPCNFDWIQDGSNVNGFLAHELAEVVPEAVSGTKDAMMDEEYEVTPAVLDDEGNETTAAVMGTHSVPDMQGIDQAKLVPLLTATIQELIARIEALEA